MIRDLSLVTGGRGALRWRSDRREPAGTAPVNLLMLRSGSVRTNPDRRGGYRLGRAETSLRSRIGMVLRSTGSTDRIAENIMDGIPRRRIVSLGRPMSTPICEDTLPAHSYQTRVSGVAAASRRSGAITARAFLPPAAVDPGRRRPARSIPPRTELLIQRAVASFARSAEFSLSPNRRFAMPTTWWSRPARSSNAAATPAVGPARGLYYRVTRALADAGPRGYQEVVENRQGATS